MKKLLAILIAFTSVIYAVSGQTVTSVANGNWYMPTTWDCACIPLPGYQINVNHEVILDNDFALSGGSITVGTNGVLRENTSGRYLVMNNGSITNNGKIMISRLGFYGGSFVNNDSCKFYSVFFSGADAENYGSITETDSLFVDAPLYNDGLISAYRMSTNDTLINNASLVATEFLNMSHFINDDNASFINYLNAGSCINNGQIYFMDFMNTAYFENYYLMHGLDDVTNAGYFYNDSLALVNIENDFSNVDTLAHSAYLENEGSWLVHNNFYNADTIYGINGLFCVGQSAANFGIMLGSFTFCVQPNGGPPDVDSGFISSTVVFNCSACNIGVETNRNTDAAVRVFPNPAADEIHFNIPVATTSADLIIYDLFGRQVMKAAFAAGNEIAVNCSRLKPGMYVFRIAVNETLLSGTFILKR